MIIGVIEILIGSVTIFCNSLALLFKINHKSFSVLVFVFAAAALSLLIGIGLLRFKRIAYQFLLYFSSVVLLSKVLILMDVLQLNGDLVCNFLPHGINAWLSIIYHGSVIYYLLKHDVKKIF